jgi:formylglycine-generating enzyme required for sulfatase activity
VTAKIDSQPQGRRCQSSRLIGVAAVVLLTAPALAKTEIRSAEVEATTSCEADLTCARATTAAVDHDFSKGPDLSNWRLAAARSCPGLLRSASYQVPAAVQDPMIGMELVLVPGACYERAGPAGRTTQVCIAPYYIGAYEVTFEEYNRFARATGRPLPDDEGWGQGRQPVINVSVYDALNFAKWLSRQTGVHYRLPTEVEWEHAARAGSKTAFPWGDEIGENRANCDGCGSRWDDEQTAPVGSFAPNAWGLYDVVGNVGEWTCSMRDPDPEDSFERCDSIYETRRRAYRNGAWSDTPDRLTVAFRDWNVAMRRTDDVGFRLVRECAECENPPATLSRATVARQGLD